MNHQLLHTPEGVRDIYGSECARKLAVQEKILQVFRLYGYEAIETPVFEYFDIFSKERGSVKSQEMYKFFDRDNNTLVLRPDMTPSIARCAAKYFMEEDNPIRLCYVGPSFINSSSYQGRLKEATQTGVELIGDDTSQGDAEMIAMVIQSLKEAGLTEFQVELGQVEFYRSLTEEAGMDEETREKLRILIENKNYFGVEELLSEQIMTPEQKQLFLKLPELFGGISQIKKAKTLTHNPQALAAIERLERVHTFLEEYHMADYVSYDLGMLSRYQYYTGIIFKAYTYGTGDYIVTGGRYNKLLVQFGKDTPAVGFAIVVDQLMAALSRQQIHIPVQLVNTVILYEPSARQSAVRLSRFFRSEGTPVQAMVMEEGKSLEDYKEMAKKRGLRTILCLKDAGNTVTAFDMLTGNVDETPVSAYGVRGIL